MRRSMKASGLWVRASVLGAFVASAAGCGAMSSHEYMAPSARASMPMGSVGAIAQAAASTESFQDYGTNPMVDAQKDNLSTFAMDVDTASYALSRRMLREGQLPVQAAVRAEEFVNSFDYGYAAPTGDAPFAVHVAAAPSPFQQGHHVMRVGLQTKRIEAKDRAPVHLVYLVDTSGSMQSPDKLELVKTSLRILTDSLKQGDTVAISTYAGGVREVLAPTGIDQKASILSAIDNLSAGGGTAMASGVQLAYELASRTMVKGHTSRVVVLSDGDANIGPTSHDEILKLIEEQKQKGIYLSTIGFGRGNYKDTTMEQLADKGNGNYSYVDDERQAKRVFGQQVNGLLETVARDAKVQVEFDQKLVESYRLIGYENRDVADRDFRNDKVDGGEVGAGHAVTALYDVVLKPGAKGSFSTVRVRYASPTDLSAAAKELSVAMPAGSLFASFDEAPANLRFAASVARFAEVLRGSPHAKSGDLALVEKFAKASASDTEDQQELVALVRDATRLAGLAAPLPVAR